MTDLLAHLYGREIFQKLFLYLLDRLIISRVAYQPVNIAMGTPEGAYDH